MEIYHLTIELNILYVTASSFPNGIDAAFDKLKKVLPDGRTLTLFGISKPDEHGEIIYKAGVLENNANEAKAYGLETFVLQKGDYLCQTVDNWENNVADIGRTFMALLKDPRLDPATYCIEWYKGDDVMCMIKIKHRSQISSSPD